jgi:hypothetical protein
MNVSTSLNRYLLGFCLLLFASLSFAQGQTYKVVKDANVRSGPSTDFAKIGTVNKGTLLTVLGTTQSRKWYQVQMAGGVTGYIYAPLMAPAQQATLPVVQPAKKATAPVAAAPAAVPRKPLLKKPASGTQTAQAAPKRLAPKRVAPQQAAARATAPQRTLAPKTVQQPARTAAPATQAPAPALSAEAQIAAAITQTLVNTLVGTPQAASTTQQAATVVTQPSQVAVVPNTTTEEYIPELVTFYCEQGVDELFYVTYEGDSAFLQSADGSEYVQLAHNGEDEYWDYYANQELVFAVNFDNEAWVSDAQGNRLLDHCYGQYP